MTPWFWIALLAFALVGSIFALGKLGKQDAVPAVAKSRRATGPYNRNDWFFGGTRACEQPSNLIP